MHSQQSPDGRFKKLGSPNGDLTHEAVRPGCGGLASNMQSLMETVPTPPPTPPLQTGPGVVSTGWLGANSTLEQKRENRLVSGLGASIALHAITLLAILAMFTVAPPETLERANDLIKVVFLPDPGPGGGGGGSPAPAPPKPMQIPHHKAPEAPPVVPPPLETPPPPTLNAPILTTNMQVIQAAGMSSISLAPRAGSGTGDGLGPGRGSGVGPGRDGGFGDGAYGPGNGVIGPKPIREVQPKYTPDAMRARIQGDVYVDVIIRKDGTVGDVRIAKSLDASSGLDQSAMAAARAWLFQPATRQGQPVDYRARLVLTFRIF